MPFVYNRGMFDSGSGNIWGTMDARALLVGTGYVPNRDHDFVADVVASEISTSGYARQTLTGEVLTLDDTNDRVLNDADDAVWTSLGPSSGGPSVLAAIVYRNTGADATSPLWFYMDGTTTTVNGSNFTYQWASTGLAIQTSP